MAKESDRSIKLKIEVERGENCINCPHCSKPIELKSLWIALFAGTEAEKKRDKLAELFGEALTRRAEKR